MIKVSTARILCLYALLFCFSWANLAVAAELQSAVVQVVAVSDGDTVHVMLNGERVRVRLANIDAPEHGQAFGQRSEQALRALVWKKQAVMTWRERDRYGRPIVNLVVDGLDASTEQVRMGMAWVFERYSTDNALPALQAAARAAQIGLWVDRNPVAPWDWRAAKRAQ
jgi:micrococcal nuclease